MGGEMSFGSLLASVSLGEALGLVLAIVVKVILPIVLVPTLCVLAVALIRSRQGRFSAEASVALVFCLVGGALGFAAGFSRNPVVDVVLTVTVTLVATLLSYVAARGVDGAIRQAAPTAMLGFALALWIALIYGASLRFDWVAMIG
ncbi:hypothetical protein [Saccharospirillum salsuginis]|uniref:Uncharacterized protein n=1 Tax=Saccharospirillum salsuginis TaxID=418750 RepID=A0A918NFF4_9GAMM|nr:hypothetical protein [Saccharospirillum salsuginis]GGX66579.1 hypothetical protein GCM10007392_37880 [Saccharospirillum salsuginis]